MPADPGRHRFRTSRVGAPHREQRATGVEFRRTASLSAFHRPVRGRACENVKPPPAQALRHPSAAGSPRVPLTRREQREGANRESTVQRARRKALRMQRSRGGRADTPPHHSRARSQPALPPYDPRYATPLESDSVARWRGAPAADGRKGEHGLSRRQRRHLRAGCAAHRATARRRTPGCPPPGKAGTRRGGRARRGSRRRGGRGRPPAPAPVPAR
jgi:hypothetical protein